MTFSAEWEKWYVDHPPIDGWYPELQRLFKYFVSEADDVLELGVGSGGNVSSILSRGWRYHGIDGSETAVRNLKAAHPEIAERIVSGDFTQALPYPNGKFDLIFDRASLPHNNPDAIRRGIDLAWNALKPGGIFVASDWFSTWHSEFRRGEHTERHTRTGYTEGQFADVGTVHFFDEEELVDLFGGFEGIHMEERCVRRPMPNKLVKAVIPFRHYSRAFDRMDYRSAVWDIVVRKPKEAA